MTLQEPRLVADTVVSPSPPVDPEREEIEGILRSDSFNELLQAAFARRRARDLEAGT